MVGFTWTEAQAVAQVEYGVANHLHIAVETEVHLFVAESRTVENPCALIVVVLVKAMIKVIGCHAVGKDMGTVGAALAVGRTTALLVATLLESVAVDPHAAVFQITVPDSPAVVNQTGIDGIIEIPTIVAVSPAAVAVPLVAWSGIEFVGEAVGIAAVRLHIIIIIGVTVDDLVIAAKEELRVTVVAAVVVLVEAELQTRITIAVEITALDDAVGGFELHTIVGSFGEVDISPVPIIGKGVHQYPTELSGIVVAGMRLCAEVEYGVDGRPLIGLGIITEDTDAMAATATLTHVDEVADLVGACLHPKSITCHKSFYCNFCITHRR